MKNEKLWQKNFSLIVIGQIISLFGNNILRFALSMCILDQTGSVSTFATILAISMIPTILLSSLGGILADRVNKRNIMVGLDFITSIVILFFASFLLTSNIVITIGILMIILSIIQSFYQPSVQSSIPIVVSDNNLIKANGIVIEVNALASLVGPIIGGFLYGLFGIMPILYISGICFFLSAVMEIFITMHHQRSKEKQNVFKIIKSDFKEASHFLLKEQKPVFYLLLLIAGLNFFLSAMLIVGLPYLIKIFLNFSNEWYGFIEAGMGVGAIIGGMSVGLFIKKIDFKKSYKFLLLASLFIFPIGISVITNQHPMITYFLIFFSVILIMSNSTLFTIYGQTLMQKLTPKNMLGKVVSVVTVISMCALPLGQIVYGLLFDLLKNNSYLIILLTGVVSILISYLSKKVLATIKE